ncbi:MAG TPA: HigA family addiction module antitoxin [Terriglobales bacterium]|nr:HigA family addiction module antitoxin [Terriglobales bacterium]
MATVTANWVRHPGYYIKEEMEARGWSQRDLAFILGSSDQLLNPILNGKRGISPDMAKALGEAFDVPAEFFANLQQAYDLAQARTPDPSVAARRNLQSAYPVREMIKRGWIELSDAAMIETQLVRFFGKQDASEVPYFGRHAAKKSSYEEREIPPTQLAWLFRVRQIARSVSAPPYSEKGLRAAIGEFQSLLYAPEEIRRVPRILMECGVRFIIVEKLPNADIDGVCFWLDAHSPVIGMSTRRDKIDNFWFVLRHECEHVLQGHGRNEEMIDDNLEGEKASTSKTLPPEEQIANAAAADFCVPTGKLNSFLARKHPFYYEKDVIAFARLLNRHPGLVVGQMQHRLERYDYLTRYLVKVRQFVLPGSIADGWGQVVPVPL